MNILILNGSPHIHGNTAYLTQAFARGAQQAGHDVTELAVGQLDIHDCIGCEYCIEKGGGHCFRKDDMVQVMDALQVADVLVLASPIYYFTLTGQMQCLIDRLYPLFSRLFQVRKTCLLLSSGASGVYDLAISQYHQIFQDWMGLEDAGILTAYGGQNRSKEKWQEAYQLGFTLQ